MIFRKWLLPVFLGFSFGIIARGQIFSPAADDSFPAAYNATGGTDEVFIFNRPDYQGFRTATIEAVSVDKQTGWNFTWARYDLASQSYITLPGSTLGWQASLDTLHVSSGYQVTMTKSSLTYVFRVWVLFNDFQVTIENKDADNKILFGYYNCSSLDLKADTTLVPLYYYDPDTKEKFVAPNNYTIRWKTDNPEASTPSSRLITRVNNPPFSNTWYILQITDRYNLLRKDSVYYTSIQSKASLSATYVNLSDSLAYPGKHYGWFYNDQNKSAPGKYRFDISASRNAVTYHLDFGDGETLDTTNDQTSIMHEFQKPGTYNVVLTTKSAPPYECEDEDSTEATLVYGKLALPNVFTPNNDGENDQLTLYQDNNVFRSEDISVISIDISIFDRAGQRVHMYSGNMRDWKGWDGRVMHSNRDAPEGVYYYVITALIYFKDPENPISHSVYSGFFHLYRR
jgi:gliding motility-associated-like protein